jgi:tetraacyldisaccharide 4'-kinase
MAATSVLRRPSWWRTRSWLAVLWLPAGLLFQAISSLRRLAFHKHWLASRKLGVPVIVVGNIAVGGSGKTPVVIWLCAALRRRGWHPGILSRGYGGTARIPTAVTPESSPTTVGDEPVLLARRTGCPLWIGSDRAAVGAALLAAHPEVNILVTDDGLQHYRLQRDAEIVVLDEAILGNLWPMPAGPLREPPARLANANLLIDNGPLSPALLARLPPLRHAAMQLEPGRFYRLANQAETCTAAAFGAQATHAIAGIGHPERFFETLRTLGITLASSRGLPDHHALTTADLSVPAGEVLLLTEKDAVKCPSPAPDNVWVLPVEARIDDAALDDLLEPLHGS